LQALTSARATLQLCSDRRNIAMKRSRARAFLGPGTRLRSCGRREAREGVWCPQLGPSPRCAISTAPVRNSPHSLYRMGGPAQPIDRGLATRRGRPANPRAGKTRRPPKSNAPRSGRPHHRDKDRRGSRRPMRPCRAGKVPQPPFLQPRCRPRKTRSPTHRAGRSIRPIGGATGPIAMALLPGRSRYERLQRLSPG
jgi:hypothetical protein